MVSLALIANLLNGNDFMLLVMEPFSMAKKKFLRGLKCFLFVLQIEFYGNADEADLTLIFSCKESQRDFVAGKDYVTLRG